MYMLASISGLRRLMHFGIQESAIKFFSYEYSVSHWPDQLCDEAYLFAFQKRLFARYWDCVPEQTDISGTSRFISGGIGGITSQITIYPVETLKTQLQSRIGRKVEGESALRDTARAMWKSGGIRAYYRGLTVRLFFVEEAWGLMAQPLSSLV